MILTDTKTGSVFGAPLNQQTPTPADAASVDTDNTALIHRVLEARTAMAKLLGMNSYAEYSLATNKQVRSIDAVNTFLSDLAKLSHPRAITEHDELVDFARKQTGDSKLELKHWDVAYWSERMRKTKFMFSDEQLKPYFPLPKVLSGLFDLVQRLYGVTIRRVTEGVEVWHPDVQYFEVFEHTSSAEDAKDPIPIAGFFVDPYSRPGTKRGGAWMDVCISRSKSLLPRSSGSHSFRTTLNRSGERVRMPIAYLICNQSQPTTDPVSGAEIPSLMTFRELETLFHEFGHVSQHILTAVDESMVSGIANVEWDAVEFPSQLM